MVVLSTLPRVWVEKIFSRLSAIYGTSFSGKFGNDIENALQVWGEELGGFMDNPDAIAYALKNLDPKFPPSAIEFRDTCRRAPKKSAPALPAPEYDAAKAIEAAKKVEAALVKRKDVHAWAKFPRSQMALNLVISLAKQGERDFIECLDSLREAGNVVGDVLKNKYDGRSWVRA